MKLRARLAELGQDLEAADHGRLQLGLVVTVTTVAVFTSGWPAGHPVQRGLFLVLGFIPALAIGAGLVVGGLIEARSRRTGEREADEREVRVLRGWIAEESGGSPNRGARVKPAASRPPPASTARRRVRLRAGHLGLR